MNGESDCLLRHIMAMDIQDTHSPEPVTAALDVAELLRSSPRMCDVYETGNYQSYGYPSRSEAECALATFFLRNGMSEASVYDAMSNWSLAHESWLRKPESYRRCTLAAAARAPDGGRVVAACEYRYAEYHDDNTAFGAYVKATIPIPCIHSAVMQHGARLEYEVLKVLTQFMRECAKMSFRDVRDFYMELDDYYRYDYDTNDTLRKMAEIYYEDGHALHCNVLRRFGLCVNEDGCEWCGRIG